MVFQTINKKLLKLGPSLGFLYKKKNVYIIYIYNLFYKFPFKNRTDIHLKIKCSFNIFIYSMYILYI